MRCLSRFALRNELADPVFLHIEPEGVCLALGSEEEVSVIDEFVSQPVTVKCSKSEDGQLIISIWPGDGEVRIEKEGVDILDLL